MIDGNYIAMIVTMIIWFGIFLFLNNLDNRIKNLEKHR